MVTIEGKDYVKNAVNICKNLLDEDSKQLKTGKVTDRPMPKTCRLQNWTCHPY
jgi:hypothetical protein